MLLVLFGGSSAAEAQVAVFAAGDAVELAHPLRAELRSRGYEVLLREGAGDLEGLAAALWVEDLAGEPTTVRICVFSLVAGSARPRCERVRSEDPTILVIRVVEAVRAQVVPGRARDAETLADTDADADADADADTDADTDVDGDTNSRSAAEPEAGSGSDRGEAALSLWVGPTLLFPGRGVAAQLELGLRWQALPLLSLAVLAAPGIVDASFREPEGEAEVRFHLGALAIELGGRLGRARLGLALEGGLVAMLFHARAEAPYLPRTSDEFAGLLAARAQVRIDLGARLALGVAGRLGVTLPASTLEFAGREIATLGLPLGSATLSLHVAL